MFYYFLRVALNFWFVPFSLLTIEKIIQPRRQISKFEHTASDNKKLWFHCLKLYINLREFGVGRDERFTRRYFGAHEYVKNFIGFFGVVNVYFFQYAIVRVHGCLPEFFRIHFSETFKALNVKLIRFQVGGFRLEVFTLFSPLCSATCSLNLLNLANFRILADNF